MDVTGGTENPGGGNNPAGGGQSGGNAQSGGQSGAQPGGGGQSGTNAPGGGSAGAAVGGSGIYGSGASLATYRVTGADTVTYVKCRAKKSAKTVTVPASIVINGKAYRVTAVAASAFSGRNRVTKLTIGENVSSIGAKAFQKCKKLKTLTVKSKALTAKGCRKCLKGSYVTTVKVPGAKKKAYKKVFKKSNSG